MFQMKVPQSATEVPQNSEYQMMPITIAIESIHKGKSPISKHITNNVSVINITIIIIYYITCVITPRYYGCSKIWKPAGGNTAARSLYCNFFSYFLWWYGKIELPLQP